MSLLGVNGHTAVVAHVLMASGGDVEERGLPAVRVADKCDTDHVMSLFGKAFHLQIQSRDLVAVILEDRDGILFGVHGSLCLVLTDHVYEGGFGAPQRNLVAKYLIFNRILQWGIEHDSHPLPVDEAHLYEPFPEATVAVHLCDDTHLTGF